MKLSFLLCFSILFAFINSANAQTCGCASELDFVVKYYEANLPGFADNVTEKNRGDYEKLKKDLAIEAEKTQLKTECFKILVHYVKFFRDNHSTIRNNNKAVNENDANSLKEFFTSEDYLTGETYELKDSEIKQYPADDIRGIYQTADAAYTIAIVPNKGVLRTHIGVIIESRSPLWKKGQIKLELNANKKGGYEAFSYLRNHSLNYSPNFELKDGILGDVWFKTDLPNKVSQNVNVSNEMTFKVLNDNIGYLHIPTFSGSQTAKIAEFYKRFEPEIAKMSYLIIDVRNNGGGSDGNVLPLLKYIYTKPFQEDTVELYVTEGTIKAWEKQYEINAKDKVNFSEIEMKFAKDRLERMKKAPLNSFLPLGSGDNTVTLDKVLKNPKKVAIITNKNCASSCETLLFWAKESDKTIIVGENSGGYVGYGEVGNIETPCFKFTLSVTKTRYKKQRQFEGIGIAPNYRLDDKSDWVEQTIKLLVNGVN